MKKTITFLCAGLLTLGLSAQNFGVGLDYMMLSGTMVDDVTYLNDGAEAPYTADDSTEVSSSSAVLNLSYTYAINDDMSAVLSAGYGMGFGIVPLKASLSYGVSSSISLNAGMGLYMITDAGYTPVASDADAGINHLDADGNELNWKGSSNEFGGSLGLKYHMNNIGIGLGYEMIKGGDHNTLNSFTIGLSYSFGGGSGGESAPAAPAGK